MQDYKITVVIPIYNEETYLDQCVSSVCNQTYKNLEIILVDDGSQKECAVQCDKYALNDERIKVIHKKNGGLLRARRTGILAATGDYICFVDADDWIEAQLCAEYAKKITYEPDFVASSNYYRNYADGSFVEVFQNTVDGYYGKESFEKMVLNKYITLDHFYDTRFPLTMCLYLFRTDIARKITEKWDSRIKISEDYAFVTLCLLNAATAAVTPYRGYHYRCNRNSMCYTIENAKDAYKDVHDLICKEIAQSEYNKEILYKKNNYALYQTLMIMDYAPLLELSDQYLFPYTCVTRGSRIALYGMGSTGVQMYRALAGNNHYEIVALIDKNYKAFEGTEYNVMGPDVLNMIDYDFVVISILYANVREEAKKELMALGVEEKKIAEPDEIVLSVNYVYEKEGFVTWKR